MKDVYSKFKESDIFIRSCKNDNVKAAEWLLTMDTNLYTQDENEMTHLMYAVKYPDMLSVVEKLITGNNEYIYFEDKNGDTALFHAVNNPKILEKLLDSSIDINHQNKNKENVFLYCCKNDMVEAIEVLISKFLNIDFNCVDKEGRTGPMYILDHEYYSLFNDFLLKMKKWYSSDLKFDINYYNSNNDETLISILIKQFYNLYTLKKKNHYESSENNCLDEASLLGKIIFNIFNYPGCNVNIPIDEDGNTAIMFFLMMKDFVILSFLIIFDNIDLSVKNKFGINASLLSVLIVDENNLLNAFVNYKTFDIQFVDYYNNSLLIYGILFDNEIFFEKILSRNEKSLNQLNNDKENAIIVASKLGFIEKIRSHYFKNADFNQQDCLGNTALFYAIKIKDLYAINLLVYNKTDVNIKNNQGVSALDLAKEMDEKKILDIIHKPIAPYKMKEKLEGGTFSFLKKKNSDEKINNYIKNYQINNYQEKYNKFINDINRLYTDGKILSIVKEKIGNVCYYALCSSPLLDRYIPLKEFNAKNPGYGHMDIHHY